MKNQAKTYMIIGIVFLAVGVTMLLSGSVSRVMAYGDMAIGLAFLALSARAKQ